MAKPLVLHAEPRLPVHLYRPVSRGWKYQRGPAKWALVVRFFVVKPAHPGLCLGLDHESACCYARPSTEKWIIEGTRE
jgi:hypothetical protein